MRVQVRRDMVLPCLRRRRMFATKGRCDMVEGSRMSLIEGCSARPCSVRVKGAAQRTNEAINSIPLPSPEPRARPNAVAGQNVKFPTHQPLYVVSGQSDRATFAKSTPQPHIPTQLARESPPLLHPPQKQKHATGRLSRKKKITEKKRKNGERKKKSCSAAL